MAGAIQFMALMKVLPPMLWFFDNKIGIKITVGLLRLFDDFNDSIRSCFQSWVWSDCQRLGNAL